MHSRGETGRTGEELAARTLQGKGYRILDRNVRTRYGEIDLVAQDGSCIVFVEVRTRRSKQMTPEESITRTKQRRVGALAVEYLKARGLADRDWRADVVAIELGADGKPTRLEHLISAIEEI
jgi:putative endonuclease